jgi:hypothetical protein
MFKVKFHGGYFNQDFRTYAEALEYLIDNVDGWISAYGRIVFNGTTILTRDLVNL